MPLETRQTIRQPRPPARVDIAALAAHLRRNVEAATQEGDSTGTGTPERRLLRRLFGALSAFEAAYGILGHSEPVGAGGQAPALTRQACPACGRSEFEVVTGLWAVHLLCRHCRACSRPERHSLALTDPDTCLGCDFADRCINRVSS